MGNNKYRNYTWVKSIEEGMSWASDQALPIFSTPAEVMDMISSSEFIPDERVTFSSLQGLVNKDKNRILMIENDSTVWADELGVDFIKYDNTTKYDLMVKYKEAIKGIVLYDTSKSNHYRNLASTIANIKGFMPVIKEVRKIMEYNGIHFSGDNVIDITGLEFTSGEEIYNYLYDNYWKYCSKRIIFSLSPGGVLDYNRDIAAAVGGAVIYCDTLSHSGKAQYERFLKEMADAPGTSIVLGWFPEERSGITAGSKYGISTLPADFYISGTVYSGADHTINIPKVPKRDALKNKAYIALYLSDGDNIQYCQRSIRTLFEEEKQDMGKTAVNWTIAPGLADIGPMMLNYCYKEASDKECFVTGPSGMGYLIPFNSGAGEQCPAMDYLIDEKYVDNYTRLTQTYLQKSGIRVITTWDGSSDMNRKYYEKNCRDLNGVTVQDWDNMQVPEVSSSDVNDRLHFEKLCFNYTGSYDFLCRGVKSDVNKVGCEKPLFFSYQINRWSKEMTTGQFVKLEAMLKQECPGKEFEFVRADHYFSYYNEYNGLPFDLCMLKSTDVSVLKENCLVYDFGKDYIINRYMIKNASGIKALKIEISENGKEWTVADEYFSNTDPIIDIDIDQVKARYLKITISDTNGECKVGSDDMEVYGKIYEH